MSIVIKKKRLYHKKKMLQRAVVLVLIYIVSFITLYAIFAEPMPNEHSRKQDQVIQLTEGEKYLAENKITEAIEFYKKRIDNNEEDYIAMTHLAIAYKKINDIKKAKFYLYKSLELAPSYPLTYIHFADIYIMEKNYNIAENAIDIIPTKSKDDFINKANLLIKLATQETDIEEKFIHYDRALTYYKKYAPKEYNIKTENMIDLLFKLAEENKKQNDIKSAMTLYKKVTKYKNNCDTQNKLAIKYMDISADTHALHAITKAVANAETQNEKRLTKENLIILKYYFEKKNDINSQKAINELLNILDESTILVNEVYMPYSVVNEEFELIKKKKDINPQITFSVLNKTNTDCSSLYVKIDLYIHSKKIIESKKFPIAQNTNILRAGKTTSPEKIKLDTKLNEKKLSKYIIALSISEDNREWKLYRLYQQK